MSEWVPVAETAKLIRAALRVKFPGVKFSVRSDSFSMGSAVRIRWTDGPTEKQVQKIASAHETIHRDAASGEILGGANRYITCERELSERVKEYARKQIPTNLDSDHERDHWTWRIAQCVEVRPDGQLLEWHQ